MDTDDRIDERPGVMAGKPVVKGTRVTVELIVVALGRGLSAEQVAESYRNITVEDVHAAVAYADERDLIDGFVAMDRLEHPTYWWSHEDVKRSLGLDND